MDSANLPDELRKMLAGMLTTDVALMRETIERCYDPDAQLQNPYMVLTNRDQIIRSYEVLISGNLALSVEVNTITHDEKSHTVMIDLFQYTDPKALGGLVPLKIHQILKLQLETQEPAPASSLYSKKQAAAAPPKMVVTSHSEIHVAQTQLSQLPIVGGLYESGLRSAVGRLTLVGGGVLEYTGVLDAVPWAVHTIGAVASGASRLVSDTTATAVRMTGVPYLYHRALDVGGWFTTQASRTVGRVAEVSRDVTATLIEEGAGVRVKCYSMSCRAGQVCYSPTCPRGRIVRMELSVENLQNVVKGMYLEGGKMTGLIKQ